MNRLLLNLFPSPVFVFDLDGQELDWITQDIDRAELDLARHLDQGRHAVETNYDLAGKNWLIELGLQGLADHIHQCQLDYFAELHAPPQSLKIVESWFNWYSAGGHMGDHEHPGCVISGVYYHRVGPNSGDLCFRNPNPVILNRLWPSVIEGMETVEIPPQPGRLVMFPSWMTHSVNTVRSQKTSISFNMR